MSVITTWGPFVITILYTVVACILGYNAKGKLDMDKVENWSSSGNTLGIIVMIFLTGAGNVKLIYVPRSSGLGIQQRRGMPLRCHLHGIHRLFMLPDVSESQPSGCEKRLQDASRRHRRQIRISIPPHTLRYRRSFRSHRQLAGAGHRIR